MYDLRFVYGTDQLLAATHGRGLWTVDTAAVPSYAPTQLVATASGTSAVNVTWNSYASATSYQLLKSSGGGTYAPISVPINSYSDTNVISGTTYLYKVKAIIGSTSTDSSNIDLATTISFTDDNTLADKSILASHLQEVRNATNMVLVAAGLPQITFPALTPDVTLVTTADITDARSALINAYYSIGLPIPAFSPLIADLTVVQAGDFQDVRNLVK